MMKAPIHPRESARLASLRAYRVLDTPPDPALDDLTALAAEICNAPISLISLLDAGRQWFKSRCGIDAQETGRDVSFCGHAICADETFVVEDAALDPRFSDNPLVTRAPHIRFYAGVPLRDTEGLPLGTLCIIDDKPRHFDPHQKLQLERLARQASRQLLMHKMLCEMAEAAHADDLTGLLNRRGLLTYLGQLPEHTEHDQSLIFIDLNRFKPINDSLGHEAGDAVLRETGKRLRQVTEQATAAQPTTKGQVARIGGDEFVIAIHGQVAERWIEHTVLPAINQAIATPIPWHGRNLVVSASLGLVHVGVGQPLDVESALRDADIAMYEAKRAGSSYLRFDRHMFQKVSTELDLEVRLREALIQGHIRGVFEPIVDLSTRRVLGFETLARWTDPQLGAIPPLDFIPIAERCGLIDQVFHAVAETSLKACASVTAAERDDLWFSVNLSKAQLNDARLFDQLEALLQRYKLPAKRLQLEITESLVAGGDAIIPRLHRLREMGHPLMLDDFGAGTSSLSCLSEFPVDWVKIDRQLTRAASGDRGYAAVVHAVSDLCHNLGLNLITEGIEQCSELAMLQAMEVTAGQGWYWSKPIEAADLPEWLALHQNNTRTTKALAG